jgi:hypothetical protein
MDMGAKEISPQTPKGALIAALVLKGFRHSNQIFNTFSRNPWSFGE